MGDAYKDSVPQVSPSHFPIDIHPLFPRLSWDCENFAIIL